MTTDRPLPILESRIRILENRVDALEARLQEPDAGDLSGLRRQSLAGQDKMRAALLLRQESALRMRANLKRSKELGIEVERLLRGM